MQASYLSALPLLLLLLLLPLPLLGDSVPSELHDSDWQQELLDGSDWLVKFYAPWCPACRQAAPMWRQLAAKAATVGLRVAQIDVSANQIVGGLFLVTQLPTVYLVKAGRFYHYDGPRSVDSLLRFVSEAEYNKTEPLAWYRAPTALHMRLLGYLIKVVVSVKDLHAHLTEERGLPPAASYAAIAVASIGACVGVVVGIVCCCDIVFPPAPPLQSPPTAAEPKPASEASAVDDGKGEGDGSGDGDAGSEVRRRPNAEASGER